MSEYPKQIDGITIEKDESYAWEDADGNLTERVLWRARMNVPGRGTLTAIHGMDKSLYEEAEYDVDAKMERWLLKTIREGAEVE